MEPELYKHYFLRSYPSDITEWSSSEPSAQGNVVFEPYPEEIFQRTRQWIESWNLFPAHQAGTPAIKSRSFRFVDSGLRPSHSRETSRMFGTEWGECAQSCRSCEASSYSIRFLGYS